MLKLLEKPTIWWALDTVIYIFSKFLKTLVCDSNLPSKIRKFKNFRGFDELVVPQTCFFKKVDFCCGDRCLLCFWFRKVENLKFFRVFCAKREILELKHYVQDQTKPLTSQNHTFRIPRTRPQNVCPVHRFGTKLLKRLHSNPECVIFRKDSVADA